MPEPRALSEGEIADTLRNFRRAAAAAIRADADAVEIHGANGYLVQQFLSTNANRRTDRYGGSIPNRIRFAVEVASAVADEIGADRTGIRISPGNPFNDVVEDDVPKLYGALMGALASLDLAYLHVAHGEEEDLLRDIRSTWPGVLVLNRGGAGIEARARDIEEDLADAVAVGAMVLAAPDLVHRFKTGAPLDGPDPASFYGGDWRGYTDHPTLPATILADARVG